MFNNTIIPLSNQTLIHIVQVSDPYTPWLVIATFILAGCTIFGILLSNKRTKESVELTRAEMSVSLRPWIGVIDIQAEAYLFEDGSVENYEAVQNMITKGKSLRGKIKNVSMDILIKNVGTLPAKDVQYRLLLSDKTITRTEVESAKITDKAVLLPGEKDHTGYDIGLKQFDSRITYYVGICVEYDVNKRMEHSGKIWELSGNTRKIIEDWI